MEDLWKS